MRLPLCLLEKVTGRNVSAHEVAAYLGKVGFPVEEIIELLPYDPDLKVAQVTGLLEELDDGVMLSVSTGGASYTAFSHIPIAAETIVGIALGRSQLAKKVINHYPDANALVLTGRDLGMDDDSIVTFPDGTILGEQLTELLETTVLNVEITPNRGDLYSLYGLIRELGAKWGDKFTPPSVDELPVADDAQSFKLKIEAKDDVLQYYGYFVENVKVKESPFWLKWCLHAFGARSINNVVDVSNYVTFLTGQPLHAFDAGLIGSSLVQVRRARENEKFTAIDHKEYKLSEKCLLIADDKHPLALAGVMGGADSEVSQATVRLFLESAHFSANAIRNTIEHTNLHSESSKRFAAGVDGEMVRFGAMMFLDILADLCPSLTVSAEFKYGDTQNKGKVQLSLSKLDAYAATTIDKAIAAKNLELIGFKVALDETCITATVPSHRNDIAEDVDIIEEVLRLGNYDELPSSLVVNTQVSGKLHPHTRRIGQIRDFLTGLGLSESYTLSLVSRERIPDTYNDNLIELANPLSERMALMRPSFITGMLNAAAENIRFGNSDISLYEIGNVYWKDVGKFNESMRLAILITGNRYPLSWNQRQESVDFYDIKGIVEMLFDRFQLGDIEFQQQQMTFYEGQACQILLNGNVVGELGEVSQNFLDKFDIKVMTYYCQLNIDIFMQAGGCKDAFFKPLSKFVKLERDMALLIDANLDAGTIMQFVRSEAGQICSKVDIFDSFTGNPLPEGKRNLGLRLSFLPTEKNLSKDELDELMKHLAEKVKNKFNAVIRGREGNGN